MTLENTDLTTGAENAHNAPTGGAVTGDTTLPVPGTEENKPIPPEGEAPPEKPAETTEQQEAHKQSKFQRRLDRQKSARVAAETEVRLLREQNAKLEAQSKPQEGEPKREAFEDYETYLRAVTKYDAAQVAAASLKAEREERQKAQEQGKQEAGSEKLAKDWNERETAFQSATKDYTDTVTAYVEEDLGSLSGQARQAIVESDVGPQLLYHLAKHPDVADRIADLSPLRQVAELGKLETSMAKPATRKASDAPAPPTPVNGARSASPALTGNESQAEYEAKRKTQGARWAR